MAKRNFDHIDKNFESFKKIKPYIGLSDEDFKNLQEDAHKFALVNQERCKPTPRIWNKEIWKTITMEFVDNGNLGERYWSKNRPEYRQGEGLGWPNDKHDILFLAFSVLKCELKRITANKRKAAVEDGDVTVTPRKKAKKDEAVKDVSEAPPVQAAETVDNSVKQVVPPAPAGNGIAVTVTGNNKVGDQAGASVATSTEGAKSKEDKSLTTTNGFQPAKSPVNKSNAPSAPPPSRRRKEQNVKDKTAKMIKRNEEAKRKAAEEDEEFDDEFDLGAGEKADDDVQIIDSSNIAFDLTSAFKPSMDRAKETGNAASTEAVHGNGTATNEPTGAPLNRDSETLGTANDAATSTIAQEEYRSIFGPHTPPPMISEEIKQHASSKVSGTKEGTAGSLPVVGLKGDDPLTTSPESITAQQGLHSKGSASAATTQLQPADRRPNDTSSPSTVPSAAAPVQSENSSTHQDPNSHASILSHPSVPHENPVEGSMSQAQPRHNTHSAQATAPKSANDPGMEQNTSTVNKNGNAIGADRPSSGIPPNQRSYPDIKFKVTLKDHKSAPVYLTLSSHRSFDSFYRLAQDEATDEIADVVLKPRLKGRVIVPGGAVVAFAQHSPDLETRWKGAMRMAVAAVGVGGLYEGRGVVVELARD